MRAAAIARCGQGGYPRAPFDPPASYQDLAALPWCRRLDRENHVYAAVRAAVASALGGDATADPVAALRSTYGRKDRIAIKPNWVRQEDPYTGCITTHAAVLRSVIDLVLAAFGPHCKVVVGDVALQSADLTRIWAQSGIDALRALYAEQGAAVEFLDLRREAVIVRADGYIERTIALPGDPAGYREVSLGKASYLEEITAEHTRFSIDDYEPGSTTSRHLPGRHGYLIAGSILESELFINVPKLKTHRKAGLTACMKNLIGINGDKAWIPHFREGSISRGGDEYPEHLSWLLEARRRIRNMLQGRSRSAFSAAAWTWRRLRTGLEAMQGTALSAGGGWPGNDTLWRAILDLQRVLLLADHHGRMTQTPQRQILCLVDAVVAGEGEGPLAARPKPLGVVVAGRHPVGVDLACARLAGASAADLPQLRQALVWARETREILPFDEPLEVTLDGTALPLDRLPSIGLAPPQGWESAFDSQPDLPMAARR